jgi:hypothetical protein
LWPKIQPHQHSAYAAPERAIETANDPGLTIRAVAGNGANATDFTAAGNPGRRNGTTAGASSMRHTKRELGNEAEAHEATEHEVEVMPQSDSFPLGAEWAG